MLHQAKHGVKPYVFKYDPGFSCLRFEESVQGGDIVTAELAHHRHPCERLDPFVELSQGSAR